MHGPHRLRLILLLLVPLACGGCYRLMTSEGGGQVTFDAPREVDPRDVALPAGYRIEPLATGLTFLSGVCVDDQGRVYVTEAGYSYGEAFAEPRLLRINQDGTTTVIARGENPPWTGLDYHDGQLYVAEGGVTEWGRIIRINPEDGSITALVEGLPTAGDHHTNGPLIGSDGYAYFGVGSATNSGVVGMDNWDFGWLRHKPDLHDIPARDITLVGRNFVTPNPFTTEDEDDEAVTGAFKPFGTPAEEGEVIPGQMPANGAVMRVPLSGGEVELVAWGMRNPFGFAWGPDGQLYVTQNSYDVRGSRPVWGTGDVLWKINPAQPPVWYGWPDFHAGQPLTWEGHYQAPGHDPPQFLLAEHPNEPPKPVAIFGVHASANGIAFPPNGGFGFAGQAFVAQFGDMAPGVGKVIAPVGYSVVMVDPKTGVITPFATNSAPVNGPASRLGGGGLERPCDVAFSPDGSTLYIADFGVMTTSQKDPLPRRGTGVLWRVTRREPSTQSTAQSASRPSNEGVRP